jgi:alkanesulfonate monooxygenase SsuD/methylene tetrahydromethanopterin reductase-like flavin-dependent oxidoreductase (luciferase family)
MMNGLEQTPMVVKLVVKDRRLNLQDDDRQAKATHLEHELRMFATGAAEVGRAPLAPSGQAGNYEAGRMVFAGGPNEIADRILHLHQLLGHTRQILQMDVGGLAHATFLKGIELLGTEVLPQIRKELGDG